MKTIVIRSPIWYNNSIGIKSDKITDDLRVEITYQNKDGSRLYPLPFLLKQAKARLCPLKMYRGVAGLFREIPISEMEIIDAL